MCVYTFAVSQIRKQKHDPDAYNMSFVARSNARGRTHRTHWLHIGVLTHHYRMCSMYSSNEALAAWYTCMLVNKPRLAGIEHRTRALQAWLDGDSC
jgi:hypothetical protein